jgi:hypothetical protein
MEDVEKPKSKKLPNLKGLKVMFGGLGGYEDLKLPQIQSLKFNRKKQVKKFKLNDFLDQYLQESKEEQPDIPILPTESDSRHLQYELKNLLKIRTFDEIQLDLSKRQHESANPFLINQGASKLYPNRSSMTEPNNLNRDLNVALNPFNLE